MGPVRRFSSSSETQAEHATEPSPPADEPLRNPGAEAGRAGSAQRTALELATRIEGILEDAERAAAAITAEAEEHARRYVEAKRLEADRERERRLQELDDGLEERAAAAASIGADLRREAEQVLERISALERAAAQSLSELGRPGNALQSEIRAVPEARPDAPSPPEQRGAEDAVLRAAQLAVGGSDRQEIESALREEFGIASPGPIVDEILGPS